MSGVNIGRLVDYLCVTTSVMNTVECEADPLENIYRAYL
jgi:hypothetical protein